MEAIACFDLGTSGSKMIGAYQETAYPCEHVEKFWLVDPSIRELTEPTYQALVEEANEYGHSPQSGLLSFLDPSDPTKVLFYQVGDGASRPGRLMTNKRKFTDCLVKIFAALGYMAVCGFGTEEPIPLTIGVLLPYNELEDKKLLAEWIRKTIQTFDFDGIPIRNLTVDKIRIMPEGTGIYKEYKAERVLICGHRDVTLMAFEDGKMLGRETQTFPESGFHDYLEEIRFPIGYELRASKAIFDAGRNLNAKHLLSLTQTKGTDELQQLSEAIANAREQYWTARSGQLRSVSYEGVKSIAISGGTANYFNQELTGLYRSMGIKCHWCKDLMLEFYERFGLEKKTALLHRFADCYGFFKTLPGVEPFAKPEVEVIDHA